MGPSGCGKSTTIRCINRLTEPDSGSIELDGTDMLSLNEDKLGQVRRRIGFVFQDFSLIQRLTCLDNVAMGLISNGVDPDDARDRAMKSLERVGLKQRAENKPSELSGGQQQRVGIARAMVTNPDLMLWDEPTASLDPILVVEVLDVMEELVLGGNTTMVIVTHEISFARRVADRVGLMDKGHVVEEGSPDQVLETPRSIVGMKYKAIIERQQNYKSALFASTGNNGKGWLPAASNEI
jgi:polar amino acid transport system ATP-binding protein